MTSHAIDKTKFTNYQWAIIISILSAIMLVLIGLIIATTMGTLATLAADIGFGTTVLTPLWLKLSIGAIYQVFAIASTASYIGHVTDLLFNGKTIFDIPGLAYKKIQTWWNGKEVDYQLLPQDEPSTSLQTTEEPMSSSSFNQITTQLKPDFAPRKNKIVEHVIPSTKTATHSRFLTNEHLATAFGFFLGVGVIVTLLATGVISAPFTGFLSGILGVGGAVIAGAIFTVVMAGPFAATCGRIGKVFDRLFDNQTIFHVVYNYFVGAAAEPSPTPQSKLTKEPLLVQRKPEPSNKNADLENANTKIRKDFSLFKDFHHKDRLPSSGGLSIKSRQEQNNWRPVMSAY